MSKPTTVREFFNQFPDDDACLKHLFDIRFGQGCECPKCHREAKWYPIKAERAFSCQWCGHHIHPTVGTLFEKSRTPLQLWFYAIFLFTTTRHGVSAKELQRQLGVTYKTAWRMGHEIREHMAEIDGDTPLGGPGREIEADETLVGGSVSGKGQGYKGNKTCVIGVLERDGEIVTTVAPRRDQRAIQKFVLENVLPGSTVNTDEFGGYKGIDKSGYRHTTVNHKAGEYARTDGAGVNGIENYWSQLKRSISGTHIYVSGKHLSKYAKEFEYRFNRRNHPEAMLSELLSTFEKSDA